MDFLFRAGRATAGEVMDGIPEPPSYSAVRAMLRTLEQKGHVRHEEDGRAYVYVPTVRKDTARRSALQHLVRTFFDNSAEQTMAALLDLRGNKLSDAELQRMAELIEHAKRDER
jgi:predicted transcriptional regulator